MTCCDFRKNYSTSVPVDPEFRAIGWVQDKLYSVIYEDREDEYGEYYHLVTLWKTTRQEEELYEKNS